MSLFTRWMSRRLAERELLDKRIEANERLEDLFDAFTLLTALSSHLNQRLEDLLDLNDMRGTTSAALVELQTFRRVFDTEIRALEEKRRRTERLPLVPDYMTELLRQLKAHALTFRLGDR